MAHGRSFVLRDLSEWLMVAHLSWETCMSDSLTVAHFLWATVQIQNVLYEGKLFQFILLQIDVAEHFATHFHCDW